MVDEFEKAKDLYRWCEVSMSLVGVWPLNPNYATYFVCIIYLAFHLSMEYYDLYTVFGIFDLTVLNISESAFGLMIFIKLNVLRFSVTLTNLMRQILNDIRSDNFENDQEIQIYLHYNRIAKRFFILWVLVGYVAAFTYYVKPVENYIKSVIRNESMPLILPYRTRTYFEIKNSLVFWMVWLFQFPMVYIHMFHVITIGYVFALVLHVCGKLSILVYRIRNLNLYFYENDKNEHQQSYGPIFRDIIDRHRNIIQMVDDIERVFQLVLLEELLITTLIVGLVSYNTIINVDADSKGVFVSSFLYDSTLLLLLYGYCAAGEYLVVESENLFNAYYHCQWYNSSDSFKKQLIICMIGAKKPIQLTAGGFYVFSLFSFTGILKSTAGYISMLRNMQ